MKLTQGPAEPHFHQAAAGRYLRAGDVLVRSIQSRQFRATEEVQGEISFDAEAIRAYIGQVCQRNARWDMFFARTGITPVTVIYEDMARDPQHAVDKVSDALGLNSRPAIV